MEKVKLSREVAEAIDYYEREHGDFWKHHLLSDAVESERYIGKPRFSSVIKSYTEQGGLDDILKALVSGFEVEQTPEEVVLNLWNERHSKGIMSHTDMAYCNGMAAALNAFNIKVPGVNANE